MPFLYRGVTESHFQTTGGRLLGKMLPPFEYTPRVDEAGVKYDGGWTWGRSETNAVIRHQLNQEGFPTAGVSTTPHIKRARLYATGPDGASAGRIFKIDRSLLSLHGIREFVVAAFARHPSVPLDEEVILVAPDGSPLSPAILIKIIIVPGLDGMSR